MRMFMSRVTAPVSQAVKKRAEYFVVAEKNPDHLKSLVKERRLSKDMAVERISRDQAKDYANGLHWHPEPNTLVFMASVRAARAVDGLRDCYVLPKGQAVHPQVLHIDRGLRQKNFVDLGGVVDASIARPGL